MGDSSDSLAAGGAQEPNKAGQSAAQVQSPGKLLAAGRAASELTVEEVGDALNLSAQTVRWLESDDFESLPAAAFTQGYIRNYAKHVGLDADVVVAAYQEKAGKPAVSWESPSTAAGFAEMVQSHPGVLITAVVAGVVLLIMIVLFIVWPDDTADTEAAAPLGFEQKLSGRSGDASAPSPSADEAEEGVSGQALSTGVAAGRSESPNSLAGSTTGAARFDSPTTLGAGESASSTGRDRDAIDPDDPLAHLPLAKTYPAGARPAASGAGSSAADRAPGAVVAVPADTDSATRDADGNYPLTVNRRLTPTGDDRVRVEVTKDCWIGIRSAGGETLFGLLARPGQTLNLTGEGPFRVKVGYTSGVELFFNDNPVLLEPYTRNEVASLVIGQ